MTSRTGCGEGHQKKKNGRGGKRHGVNLLCLLKYCLSVRDPGMPSLGTLGLDYPNFEETPR